MKTKLSMLFVISLLAVACFKKQEAPSGPKDTIIDSLLVLAFDTLDEGYDFNGKFLTHSDFYPDGLKKRAITELTSFLLRDSFPSRAEHLELLNRLSKTIDDSVRINVRDIKTNKVYLLFYESDSLLHSPAFFGTFGMSNPAFDDTRSKCAFYIAVNCGNDCSRGFIFFAIQKSQRWMIDTYYQVWG